MAVLARKITRSKWESKSDLAPFEIAADAVTADLRTTSNTLSVWRCASSSLRDVSRAILALASAGDRLDRVEVVCLDEAAVQEKGLATRNTPGETPVASLRDHHVDIEHLDLTRLALLAEMVAEAHRASASHVMTKKEVVALLAQGVRDNLFKVEDLKGKVANEVKEALEKPVERSTSPSR